MRHTNLLLLLITLITLSACAKAGKEVAEELGILPSTCGTDGARLEATVGSDGFCADGQIIAIADGTSASITGIGLLGNTLMIQLDTLAEGIYAINEAENAILFMAMGTPYVTMAEDQGVLTITNVDHEAHKLKADFQATVRNEMSGSTKPISGSMDVTYTTAD